MKYIEIKNILIKITLVVFDFDGVFTNNKVIVSETGEESVVCDRSDGIGLSMIKSRGIKMLILSTEKNPVVSKRAAKLPIRCIQGVDNKKEKLIEIAAEWKIPLENIAFLGNDINDLECLRVVGLPVVVADAYPEVKKIAKIILTKKGGEGAVREFCELVYKSKTEVK